MSSQTTLLGAAGEYHVMTELLLRGYIAALAPHGVPKADILVTDDNGERHCTIQVKTRRDRGSDGGWHMNVKHEEFVPNDYFTALLILGRYRPPARRCMFFLVSVSPTRLKPHIASGWTPSESKASSAMTAQCGDCFQITPTFLGRSIILTPWVGSINTATHGTCCTSKAETWSGKMNHDTDVLLPLHRQETPLMTPKPHKTEAELTALLMAEIRKHPQCSDVQSVAITRPFSWPRIILIGVLLGYAMAGHLPRWPPIKLPELYKTNLTSSCRLRSPLALTSGRRTRRGRWHEPPRASNHEKGQTK